MALILLTLGFLALGALGHWFGADSREPAHPDQGAYRHRLPDPPQRKTAGPAPGGRLVSVRRAGPVSGLDR